MHCAAMVFVFLTIFNLGMSGAFAQSLNITPDTQPPEQIVAEKLESLKSGIQFNQKETIRRLQSPTTSPEIVEQLKYKEEQRPQHTDCFFDMLTKRLSSAFNDLCQLQRVSDDCTALHRAGSTALDEATQSFTNRENVGIVRAHQIMQEKFQLILANNRKCSEKLAAAMQNPACLDVYKVIGDDKTRENVTNYCPQIAVDDAIVRFADLLTANKNQYLDVITMSHIESRNRGIQLALLLKQLREVINSTSEGRQTSSAQPGQ